MRPPRCRLSLPRSIAGLLLLAIACTPLALAQGYRDTPFKPDPEPVRPKTTKPGRKWHEAEVSLPAWPRDGDLVQVKLDGPAPRLTNYIDTRSLSTGRDGVVRYTLVTKSPSGARNVSFEGLRCTPRGRWKTYAFGMNGHFEPTTVADEWQEIRDQDADPLHYELWRNYLCLYRNFTARPKREQVRLLKSGRMPQVENEDFLTN
jgi:hypothetical protein